MLEWFLYALVAWIIVSLISGIVKSGQNIAETLDKGKSESVNAEPVQEVKETETQSGLNSNLSGKEVVFYLSVAFIALYFFAREPDYPISNANYFQVDAEVGCKSRFSEDKRKAIFKQKYKNHILTWDAVVMVSDSGRVGLNVNHIGIQDLSVKLKNRSSGYSLISGQKVKVRFVMKDMGGCFLAFGGNDAVISSSIK